jgi:nucleoside-diphosphate-sugar epimerase
MKRITVTGAAAAFMGSRLIEHLLSLGHNVTALLHLNQPPHPFGPDVRVFTAM